MKKKKPLIYVSYDRSLSHILKELGALTQYTDLTILDCFTNGKGGGADIFLDSYKKQNPNPACRVVHVDNPDNPETFMNILNDLNEELDGDARFVFDSLTGMQELWGSENSLLQFYSRTCPRLYELKVIAYWIIEKRAHSSRFRAHINKIAQVAVELAIKRGRTSISILKADKRIRQNMDILNRPFQYWLSDSEIILDNKKKPTGPIDLGMRLKQLRLKKGLSQTDLSKLVGVTPSTISQVESNLIYPSLPALFKMAEVLSVEPGAFFGGFQDQSKQAVFHREEATELQFPNLPKDAVIAKSLLPVSSGKQVEPYLIEVMPYKTLPAHFFLHKGDEVGYLLQGELQLKLERGFYTVKAGDFVYLTQDIPSQWKNPLPESALLLWMKINP